MTDSTLTLAGGLNPRSRWDAANCPIGRAMDILGNRSSFLLLREAFYGTARFDDFAARVGVSESVAAARLKDLVDAGLLERVPYREPGERTRLEYRLTHMGAEFFPVLAALMQWGDHWLGPAGVGLRHIDCGSPVRAELRCAAGHHVEVRDTELVAERRRSR